MTTTTGVVVFGRNFNAQTIVPVFQKRERRASNQTVERKILSKQKFRPLISPKTEHHPSSTPTKIKAEKY